MSPRDLEFNTPAYSKYIILKELGHSLTCLTFESDNLGKDLRYTEINGMHVIIVPRRFRSRIFNFISLIYNLMNNLPYFDLYIARDFPGLILTYFISQKTGIKYIYDSCETWLGYYTNNSIIEKFKFTLVKILEGHFIKNTMSIITHSPFSADYLKEQYKLKNNPVTIPSVYCTYLKKETNLLKERLGLSKDDRVVLSQGTFKPGRGIKNLILAFKYVPHNIKLVLMGDGPLYEHIKQMIIHLNLNDQVFIMDKMPINSYLDYTASADLGVDVRDTDLLNYKLALSVRIVDYIVCGVPVGVSSNLEVSKLIKQWDIGIVFNSNEAIDIAKGIEDFFIQQNIDKYHKNLEQLRSTLFSLDAQIEKMARILNQ